MIVKRQRRDTGTGISTELLGSLTSDQRLALRQLSEVAEVDPDFMVGAPSVVDERLVVRVSFSTAGIARGPGVELRARETFEIIVSRDFPFRPPSVTVTHRRWAGTSHVHWGRLLCLYAAPSVEWSPSDGMFGMLDRLWEWLTSAAADELDPQAAPLHPPVTYEVDSSMPQVIIRANAPVAAGEIFVGAAELDRPAEVNGRADVVGFRRFSQVASDGWPENFAVALVMSGEFDWEYPESVSSLIGLLAKRGLPRDLLIELLELSARDTPEDRPLVVLIGSPMRRIEGERLIHFTAWAIPPTVVQYLRFQILQQSDSEKFRKVGEIAHKLLDDWAKSADLKWCRVREDRSEVTRPRADGSPLLTLSKKTVAVWGCGALGAPIAEAIARVGPKRMILYDNSVVAPGLLVRQPFADADIGRAKATALAARLRAALPGLDVEPRVANVLEQLDKADWDDAADVVVDATASIAIASKLERVRSERPRLAWAISTVIGHDATRGLVTVTPPEHPAGPYDLSRKTKIRLRTRAWRTKGTGVGAFAQEFWPSEPRTDVFQPEPGCSEPTFRGSQAETASLALQMLLYASRCIVDSNREGSALLIASQAATVADHPEPRTVEFRFPPDVVLTDGVQGYEVRLAPSALAEMQGYIRRNDRAVNPTYETGGLLFGERDEAARVVWVSEVVGPPPDSEASPEAFVCGTEGVDRYRLEKSSRGLGSLGFVGTWHTHPHGRPLPSETDVEGMSGIVLAAEPAIPRALLIIAGGTAAAPELAASMFDRRDLKPPLEIRATANVCTPKPRPVERNVGLALSGGGFRALAFHLGCLRALEDRQILSRISVVSGVSGGSLAAALWAYTPGDFAAFDKCVRRLLNDGLQWKIAKRAFVSPRSLKTLATLATSGSAAAASTLWAVATRHGRRKPPFRRFSSATEAMIDVLERVFESQQLSDQRRGDVDVVLNACELRTGSAFRFGSRESHCYRYGTLLEEPSVALAVAASAAHPLLLPALDRRFVFQDRAGNTSAERVALTDGGVFDNLGISVLEPDRDPQITVTYHPDYIIACDAGTGILSDDALPFGFPSRINRAFTSTYRKAQDGTRKRLHSLMDEGKVKGFVFPYLGQRESQLPVVPPDLPSRESVLAFKTDFAAMNGEDIDLIAARGEGLTRLLLDYYCPDL